MDAFPVNTKESKGADNFMQEGTEDKKLAVAGMFPPKPCAGA